MATRWLTNPEVLYHPVIHESSVFTREQLVRELDARRRVPLYEERSHTRIGYVRPAYAQQTDQFGLVLMAEVVAPQGELRGRMISCEVVEGRLVRAALVADL